MTHVVPEISFIVPVYNVEQYLSECIESILAQTLQDYEVILIDDGSTDSSGEICDRYAQLDERIKVLHKKNAGVSAARNDGIDASIGEWAYFVDSDDWIEPDAAELLHTLAEEQSVDCVMSFCEMFDEAGMKRMSPAFNAPFLATTRDDLDELQKYILYQSYSSHFTPQTVVGYAAPWGKFVKLSVLKKNGVRFDPYLCGVFDDGLYSLYLLEAIDSLLYIHQKTYNYRVVGSSLTHSFKSNAMEIQERGYDRIERFLTTYRKDSSFWQAYYAHIVRFFGGYLTRYYFNPGNPKDSVDVAAEIRETLSREPFKRAIHDVDISILEPKDKYLLIAERLGSVSALRFYTFLKRQIKPGL